MFILNKKWGRITEKEVILQKEDLNLEIIGGLKNRGWTVHDIDVIGDKRDVNTFAQRLKKAKINNPVHFCGGMNGKHSHISCLWNGFMLIIEGKGYY